MGWTFSSATLEKSTPTPHRLRIEIEAGGSAEILATSERVLAELTERRQKIGRVETEVANLLQELGSAAANQARIRENLGAVPSDSTLARRYLSMLKEEEDRIADLEHRWDEMDRSLRAEREAFARSVRDL